MFSNLRYQLRALFRRESVEAELDAEVRAHVEQQAEKYVQAGLSPEEAARRAQVEFGSIEQVKEECREAWGIRLISELAQDLRYGLRQLRRNPGFTTVAVLTLALGIGANTAIFTLLDAVMFRSLPVSNPSQLVLLRWNAHRGPSGHYSSFGDCSGVHSTPSGCSFPLHVFKQLESNVSAFSGVTAFAGPARLDLGGNGAPRMANGVIVSGDYFSTLGVNAAIGRTIGPSDDSPAAAPVAVLSYSYWQSAFGGKRSVIGRTVTLNRVPFTIIGVADAKFTHLSPGKRQDLWLPIAMLPRLDVSWAGNTNNLDNSWLVIVARLRPEVSLVQAQSAANLIFRNEVLYGAKAPYKAKDDPRITLVSAQQGLTGTEGDYSTSLYVLMFAVGFILLIACANVAGLLLARAGARQKEMAVRLALGAGRARLFRQLLTESVMLSVVGGALGVLFAYGGIHAITALASGGTGNPFPFAVAPDWRVLLFTIALSLITGILFGLAPALHSTHVDLAPALKESAPTASGGTMRARRHLHLGNSLVTAQVGLSIMILVGAGLLVRTLDNLRSINPGFDTTNLLLFEVDPTLAGYKDSQIHSLYWELQNHLAALPGVISISYSSIALLTGSLWTNRSIHVEGQPQEKTVESDMIATGPNFFKTMRIPLLEGRMFTLQDFEQARKADTAAETSDQLTGSKPTSAIAASSSFPPPISVLVNRAFVQSYFPNQDPLGKIISQSVHRRSMLSVGLLPVSGAMASRWQVIGVIGNTKDENLRRGVHPCFYFPITGGGAHFELRTAEPPATLIRTVRKTVSQIDSNLPLFAVSTQKHQIDEMLTQERLVARLSAFFAATAMLLACIGLYGLLSYDLVRRTREIGTRMALGARRGDVLKLVIGQGLKLALIGVGIGIAGALAVTRFLSSLLYGVKPTDPLTYVVVSLLLIAVALLACYIPARRATKVDPMVALRYE